MLLIDKISKDRLIAMKVRNQFKKGVLTTLLSEASRPGLDDGKRPSTDSEVIKVCQKFIKGLNESIANTKEDSLVNRQRIHDFVKERSIIEDYIPYQMTGLEIEKAIAKYALSMEDQTINMGMIMKHLKENYNDRFDGKLASQVAKRVLMN